MILSKGQNYKRGLTEEQAEVAEAEVKAQNPELARESCVRKWGARTNVKRQALEEVCPA